VAPEGVTHMTTPIDPLVSGASFLPLENIQEVFKALCQPSTQLQMVVKHG